MTTRMPRSMETLYGEDYVLWTEKTAEQLRQKDFASLDLENLIEEIESMGRSERQAVESLLTRLIEHLLKLAYWKSERERNARHWIVEIASFRGQLRKKLKTPTLANHARDSFEEAYSDARQTLIVARIIGENEIPVEPRFSLEQTIDGNWFPIPVDRSRENQQ